MNIKILNYFFLSVISPFFCYFSLCFFFFNIMCVVFHLLPKHYIIPLLAANFNYLLRQWQTLFQGCVKKELLESKFYAITNSQIICITNKLAGKIFITIV